MSYEENFTKNLSFVLTGVLEDEQVEKIKKIRNLFEFSPILVSTWKARNQKQNDIIENLRGIQNIKVLLQDDPGPDWDNQCVNRIILSSKAAFKEVTTEFCIKTRTDIEIYGNSFIKIFLKIYRSQTSIPKYQDCRILALNLFARDPSKNGNLFHPGDNFWLGKTSDLKRFYDLPLRDLENNKTLNHNLEILMWSKVLNKVFYSQNPFHPFNNTPIDIIKSDLSIIKSFYFATEKQLCIKVPDKFYSNSRKYKDVYDPLINFYSENSLATNFIYIFRYIKIVPLFYYHYSKIFAGEYLPLSLKILSKKISKLRKKLVNIPKFFW